MMVRWLGVALLLLAVPCAEAQENRGPFARIAVIKLRDDSEQSIDPSVKTSVLRRIREAKDWGADCVVFDIESYGGLVTASIETGQEILDLGRDVHTIAYIHRRAISGAAMIALSCREIVMSEAATLGDSQAVFMGADGTIQVAPEKYQTTVAAEFRKYAERNGYPVPLAEAMVRQEMEVFSYERPIDLEDPARGSTLVFYRGDQLPDLVTVETERLVDQKVVVRATELATFHAKEALQYGFCSRIVPDVSVLLDEIATPEAEIRTMDWNDAERVSRWLLDIRGWLFLLGIVAAYIAFKTPGTGVPEVVAIILFGLFFGASAVAGLAASWEIVIFFFGVILIAIELFILPGFGVAGLAGLLLVLLSLALVAIPPLDGANEYGSGSTYLLLQIGRDFVLSALAATVVAFFLAKHLPKIPFFGRLALATPEPGSAMSSHGTRAPDARIGTVGEAESDLRPAGRARIDGKECDVVAEGAYVAAGTAIRVIEVRGPIVVVRPVASESTASAT